MKIARAMKEIARLKGEIKDLKHRTQSCLSVMEGSSFNENFDELYTTLKDRLNKMSSLKNAIVCANVAHDMHRHIIALGELKSYLDFLKEFELKSGVQESRYSDSHNKYVSQVSIKEKNTAIQEAQQEINRITDILDEFNAKTDIGETGEIVLNLPKIKD